MTVQSVTFSLTGQSLVIDGILKGNSLQPTVSGPSTGLYTIVLHLHGFVRPVVELTIDVVTGYRLFASDDHISAWVIVGVAFTLLYTWCVIRCAKTCRSIRISRALASAVQWIVVTFRDTTDVWLISHNIQELQRTFLAVNIRHINRHLILSIRRFDFAMWTRRIIMRDMIQQYDSGSLGLIKNSNTERGSGMRNRLLPRDGIPSGVNCRDVSKTPIQWFRTTCTVLVTSVVKGNVITCYI